MTTIEYGVAGGISFALTDEQKSLRELAREFAEKEIRPRAASYDETSQHPADVNGANIPHAQHTDSCGYVILPDLPVTLAGAGPAFRFRPRQVTTVDEFRKRHA